MLSHLLTFLAGILVGVGGLTIWYMFRFMAELRGELHYAAKDAFTTEPEERDKAALTAVDACKNRLRWHKNPNPEWITPLLEEIPKLVRDIADIYYPGTPQPLLGPGLSHFTLAIQLAARDVTEFLQNRTVGKLVDVSAHTALKTWERGVKVWQHQTVQKVNKWYSRLLPAWQLLRWNSPLVWASMAVSNVATRTLQPAVIDIVARRAIELYSGRIADSPAFKKLEPDSLTRPPTDNGNGHMPM